MKLLKVVSLSGFLTLLRMASSFVVAKVIAIYAGPAGMAQMGQLQSLVAALSGLVSAPLGNAIVTETARHPDDPALCAPYWRAAMAAFGAVFLLIALLALAGSGPLAAFLVGDTRHRWLVVLLVLSLPLYAVHSLLLSVLNGQQRYRRYVGAAIFATVGGAGLTVAAVVLYGREGALFAAVAAGAAYGLCVLLWLRTESWLRWTYWFGAFQREHLALIGRFVVMAVVTALVVPAAQIMVRKIIVADVSWSAAGQWQAVWKISELYLGVTISALSVYYLPRLAAAADYAAMNVEIKAAGLWIIPLVMGSALLVYVGRDLLIAVLFTPAFRPARDLFGVQLLGDVVKIASWLWAYPMVARSAVVPYVVLEVVSSGLLVLLTWALVPHYAADGANLAYLINYIFYFGAVYVVFRRQLLA